jgi:hypothetical protein
MAWVATLDDRPISDTESIEKEWTDHIGCCRAKDPLINFGFPMSTRDLGARRGKHIQRWMKDKVCRAPLVIACMYQG